MALCNPAILYLILSIIIILMGISAKVQVSKYVMKLIWIVVLFYVLKFLFSKGYTTVYWILVLLPFILIAFMALMMLEVTMRLAHRAPERKD